MQTVTTIGIDIAKSVFQVHGVDAAGQVVISEHMAARTNAAFVKKVLANSEPSTHAGQDEVRYLSPLTCIRVAGRG